MTIKLTPGKRRPPRQCGLNPPAYIIFFLGVFLLCVNCYADKVAWDKFSNEEIVEAIFKAEGGYKATWLYGIRSVKYKDEKEARQICMSSVRNGRQRWINAGKPYDLIIHIGLRYCPPKAHRLNSNWVHNVKHFLTKGVQQ